MSAAEFDAAKSIVASQALFDGLLGGKKIELVHIKTEIFSSLSDAFLEVGKNHFKFECAVVRAI
ncbi:hypothetical protein [Marinimicrobium agarilyticum]|uniref:hypothetical protein n=1 Tax=Marinimicrobium agarilyticum TaxID=306546 RepID=UPI00040DC128|nr:hypothetical protein [Marinimicrobium agarilyticum]